MGVALSYFQSGAYAVNLELHQQLLYLFFHEREVAPSLIDVC